MDFNQRDIAKVCAFVRLANDGIDPLTVKAWLEERSEDAESFVGTNKLFASDGGHVSVAIMFLQSEQSDDSERHSKARIPAKKRPIRMCRLLALLVKIATIQFEGQANLYGVWLYHGHGKDKRANVSLH